MLNVEFVTDIQHSTFPYPSCRIPHPSIILRPMPRSFEGDLNAEGFRFAIIASRFNDDIVHGLLRGALECLTRHGASDEAIAVYRVPGAFEIPTLASALATSSEYDAVIALC